MTALTNYTLLTEQQLELVRYMIVEGKTAGGGSAARRLSSQVGLSDFTLAGSGCRDLGHYSA
jgi:hypothetical protein